LSKIVLIKKTHWLKSSCRLAVDNHVPAWLFVIRLCQLISPCYAESTSADTRSSSIKGNPFLKSPDIDQSKLHVTFLSDDPPKTAVEPLRPLAAASEQLQIIGREIYLYCPAGYGNTKLSNTAIEKKLSVGATTRNWNTVKTLLEMAQ
jgi:uncharacterized protein (DUF1697 family)